MLITALDSTDDLVRGLDAGADDFLSKPVNGMELRARVRSMLRIKRQHDDLQAQHSALRRVQQQKQELLSMIVHDLKTPLFAMLLYAEGVADSRGLETKERNSLWELIELGRTLDRMILDLLDVSRSDESDQGPGVPPEQRERIFERFVRLERDAERHARMSSGLGLAFCRIAVEAHGGRIWVQDNDPTGSCFCIAL